MTDAASTLLSDDSPGRGSSLRSLGRRRLLVVVLLAVLVLVGFGTWVQIPVITLGGAVVFIAGYLILKRAIDDIADKPDAALDERLVGLRNSAYLHAYRYFATAIGFALLVLFIAADSSRFEVSAAHIQTLFLVAVGLSAALPAMLLAWSQPEV